MNAGSGFFCISNGLHGSLRLAVLIGLLPDLALTMNCHDQFFG